jgi:hypothetical protein
MHSPSMAAYTHTHQTQQDNTTSTLCGLHRTLVAQGESATKHNM